VLVQGGRQWKIGAAKIRQNRDPTGAGDAYRAGLVAGIMKGFEPRACGRMGAVCAAYTVEKQGTQTHKFSWQSFKKRYRENFNDEI
jgi:adenosine kinase